MLKQAQTKRTVVDIDTRRVVSMAARGRKPREVAEMGHEQFIRNALKDRLGWPRRDPAPESIKAAAKEMAAFLVKRDLIALAEKAAAEQAKAAVDRVARDKKAQAEADAAAEAKAAEDAPEVV
jgi:hypothetical protein